MTTMKPLPTPAPLEATAYPYAASQPPATARFRLAEATVASIHAAFKSGRLSCVQLTQMYIDRIRAYDAAGPALRAIITVNPKALEMAAEMDRIYKGSPESIGPLHYSNHPQG